MLGSTGALGWLGLPLSFSVIVPELLLLCLVSPCVSFARSLIFLLDSSGLREETKIANTLKD